MTSPAIVSKKNQIRFAASPNYDKSLETVLTPDPTRSTDNTQVQMRSGKGQARMRLKVQM